MANENRSLCYISDVPVLLSVSASCGSLTRLPVILRLLTQDVRDPGGGCLQFLLHPELLTIRHGVWENLSCKSST